MKRTKDFSLKRLTAWLETRDPNETYKFSDNRDCLLARFFKSLGYGPKVLVGIGEFCEGDDDRWSSDFYYPSELDDVSRAGGNYRVSEALKIARRLMENA